MTFTLCELENGYREISRLHSKYMLMIFTSYTVMISQIYPMKHPHPLAGSIPRYPKGVVTPGLLTASIVGTQGCISRAGLILILAAVRLLLHRFERFFVGTLLGLDERTPIFGHLSG